VKAVVLRPLARSDLIERTRHYRRVGGVALGERFFDAATVALEVLGSTPGLGSPRVGELIGLRGLRRMSVKGFPCGWLYLELADTCDVVRLLADRQDLATILDELD
jgi:toxin ParE1/3/4